MSETADLVLIYPPWPVLDDRAILQNSLPPLGILSIGSYMESLGHRVLVHDVHAEKLDDAELIRRLRRERPRVIGISVLTNMAIPALKIAKLCKQAVPGCTLVVGGVHAETMPERMLRNSAIDAVVRGDGEEPMRQIMEGVAFANIAGLSYRIGNRIRNNPAQPINLDLDKYPFPAYHLVNFKNYFPAVGTYRNYPAINMLMTRGCPGKCTFCNSARTTLRSRSPARVVEQIRLLREKHHIRQIQFYDDTFTVNKRAVLEFCDLLHKANLGITWTAYVRGDCFSDQMAAAMKKAGCHQVLMGVETGSAKIAKRIGKPIDRERYFEAIRIAHRHGMETRCSFIIGNMDETHDTMMETLNFAMDLDTDLFQLSISTPYPGTALYAEAVDRGWLRHRNWYSYGQGEVLVDQPQITDQQIYNFERFAFRRFYMRPVAIARMLRRVTHWRHVRDMLLAATVLLLGKHKKKDGYSWDCWRNLKEEDFLDLDIADKDDFPERLTFQLRQHAMA
jgi:anaerobic magnesium-protoporphyrin IX monomethyl ester cyclase